MMLTPTTRASLLLRLRDRQDHEAWAEFVSLYEPVAYRLLRRHGLQDADAHEVLQDLFVAVSRGIERFEPDASRGSFRNWLRLVIRNLVINYLKQRGRRTAAVGGTDMLAMLELVPAAGDETAEFDLELQRSLFQRAAERVRAEVQPASWQAFWETAVVGASVSDVASNLGMTVGAVRVAKCRVLARLQVAVRDLENKA